MRTAAATLRLLPRAALRLPARPSAITRGRLLAATLIALALGSLYQFWFQDSSLTQQVQKIPSQSAARHRI